MRYHPVSLVLLLVTLPALAGSWSPDPVLVQRLSQQRPGTLYDEARVPQFELPDPLVAATGKRIRSAAAWTRTKRPELLELFRANVYGRSPGRPSRMEVDPVEVVPAAMGGAAVLHRVRLTVVLPGGPHAWEAMLFLPRGADTQRPVPVFLLLNNRAATNTDPTRVLRSGFWPAEEVVARGYGIAAFQVGEVDPDRADGREDGVRGRMSAGTGSEFTWGTLAAWAWGASRVLDWLEVVPGVDARRVAVVGHSRGAKAALWAGAEDPRFGLIIANGSGCGGAAISRRRFGETVSMINRSFPHWFCAAFKSFNDREDALPVDQHELVALAAPRPVYVSSAGDDLWADPRGEYLGLAGATPVYRLWGRRGVTSTSMPALGEPLQSDCLGYHIRPGIHDLTPYEWARFVDFADRVWH